jgi:hypothetical protein
MKELVIPQARVVSCIGQCSAGQFSHIISPVKYHAHQINFLLAIRSHDLHKLNTGDVGAIQYLAIKNPEARSAIDLLHQPDLPS